VGQIPLEERAGMASQGTLAVNRLLLFVCMGTFPIGCFSWRCDLGDYAPPGLDGTDPARRAMQVYNLPLYGIQKAARN
jgi:hypothetical protein